MASARRKRSGRRCATLKLFAELGGKLIDTAPSYGSSEQVLGELIASRHPRAAVSGDQDRYAWPSLPAPPEQRVAIDCKRRRST
jgi:hypothetical protein